MLLNKASPKAISRRTSYLRVRLEFLLYPQVIRILFNEYRFGPPLDFTQVSTCSWIGHTVSGLLHDTLSFALFKLGFPSAPYLTQYLTSHHTHNSLDRSTKSTISSLNALYLLVNIGFQVLFHSPPGVLFNFPSRYFFSIGYQLVFSLGRWSGLLPTRFLVSCRTLDSTHHSHHFDYETFTLSGLLSQYNSSMIPVSFLQSSTPHVFLLMVWALPISLATTFGIDFSFFSWSYLDVSVHSVYLLAYYFIHMQTLGSFPQQVPPFRYLWFSGYLHLPIAFRSLSRLSSSLGTQAVTLRSYQLNLFFLWNFQLFLLLFTCFFACYFYIIYFSMCFSFFECTTNSSVVGLTRIELVTSRLSGVHSNHLSYRPNNQCQHTQK